MGTTTQTGSRWRRSVVGLLLALVVVASGCGGDDDAGNGSAGQGTTTAGESTATTGGTTTAATATTGTSATTTSPTGTSDPVGQIVDVYFSVGDGSDCGRVEGFPRPVPAGADRLELAFAELVAGPTAAEIEAGAGSLFSDETADVVRAITRTDGLVVVDFVDLRPLIPNASTSCGSMALLAQLNATGFQFDDVDRTRFRIEGSCDDFANWLQRECFDTARSGEQLDVPTNERASGSGCTPPDDGGLPDGRWFGFADEGAGAEELSFDLACWFTGTAAAAAASEDGEESPPPNDFHIRNASDRRRALTVDPLDPGGLAPGSRRPGQRRRPCPTRPGGPSRSAGSTAPGCGSTSGPGGSPASRSSTSPDRLRARPGVGPRPLCATGRPSETGNESGPPMRGASDDHHRRSSKGRRRAARGQTGLPHPTSRCTSS